MFRNLSKKYFQRIFLGYAVTLFLLMSVFSVSICSKSIQMQRNAQTQSLESGARILTQTVDDMFSQMYYVGLQLIDSTWVRQVCSKSEIILGQIDFMRRQEICEIMASYGTMFSTVRSAALFLPQKQQVIDGKSFWESESRYFRSMNYFSENIQEQLYARFEDDYCAVTLMPILHKTQEEEFLFAQRLDIFSEPEEIFVCLIQGSEFGKFLEKHHDAGLMSFSIVEDDEIIFQYTREQTAKSAEFEIASELYPWKYCVRVNSAAARDFSWIFFILLAQMFGLILAYIMSAMTYRPIIKLLKQLKMSNNGASELSAIEQTFAEMAAARQQVQNLSVQYYNAARENILLSLLHGTFTHHINDDSMKLFDIPLSHATDIVCMAAVLRFAESDTEERMLNKRILVQNYILEKNMPVLTCVLPDGALIMIFYGKDTMLPKLTRYAENVRKYLQNTIDGYVFSIGLPHHGLTGIGKSYQEIREQEFDAETGRIDGYYYPLDWEIQLIEQLRLCNISSVRRILQELKRENINRHLSVGQHQRVVSLILEVLKRIATELNVDADALESKAEERIAQIHGEAEDVWDALAEVAQQICQSANEGGEIASDDLGKQMQRYVDEYYRDVNLSQKGIADHFGISCPSMSKIFKNAVGKNFIDYLHELRTAAAKKAFDDGADDVQQVAYDCGYENDVTFRKVFFRAYAVTPHQYVRRVHGE